MVSAMTHAEPRTQDLWEILQAIPDPEIPVISLVELGIIRTVEWTHQRPRITISPTYVGCPANDVIQEDIRKAMSDAGIGPIDIVTALAPPWTTDWITPAGMDKLRAYGIAPPSRAPTHTCPQCGSTQTQIVSPFGSTPCKGIARCLSCTEPFEFFKCSAT